MSCISENQHPIEGYVAVNADGSFFGGQHEHGVLVVRNSGYLKRIARPDAVVLPVTIIVHGDADYDRQVGAESLVNQLLSRE